MRSESYLAQLTDLDALSQELAGDKFYQVQRQIERTRERIMQLENYERPSEKQNLFTICKIQAVVECGLDAIYLEIIKR
jgi:hypothetical protein